MNQFLWYMYIKIDNDVAIFKKLPGKGINFLIELFGENGVIKKLCLLMDKFNIENNMHFRYMQLVLTTRNSWKSNIQQMNSNRHTDY